MASLPDNNMEKREPHFLYTEECGLALFQNRATGRKFWVDLEHWNEVVECVRMGWTPKGTGASRPPG